jgi:hypothetical protein
VRGGTTAGVKLAVCAPSPTPLHHFGRIGAPNATTAWVKLRTCLRPAARRLEHADRRNGHRPVGRCPCCPIRARRARHYRRRVPAHPRPRAATRGLGDATATAAAPADAAARARACPRRRRSARWRRSRLWVKPEGPGAVPVDPRCRRVDDHDASQVLNWSARCVCASAMASSTAVRSSAGTHRCAPTLASGTSAWPRNRSAVLASAARRRR